MTILLSLFLMASSFKNDHFKMTQNEVPPKAIKTTAPDWFSVTAIKQTSCFHWISLIKKTTSKLVGSHRIKLVILTTV